MAGGYAAGVKGTIKVLPRALSAVNWLELILTLTTVFIIYGFKRITTSVPSTLVALVVVSGIAFGFNLDYRAITEIPGGLPIPNLEIFTEFRFKSITPHVFTALTLALLGAIDSLLTSVVADNMTKTKHNPNKELIGQGIGNSVGAIFGGIPGAGATIRTVVNIKAGGKTKLSGMISGVVLLLILLVLSPVASKIPAAVLAGILITVGIGVMDYKGLKAIPILPLDMKFGPVKLSSEVVIMLSVLFLSTFWNLVNAVGIGLVIASLIFMKKIGDVTEKQSEIKPLKKEPKWGDEANIPQKLKEEIYIKHINGPLFFGSITDFQETAKNIPEEATTVIMRMGRMSYLDQTGLYALEDVLIDLKNSGKIVLFVGVSDQPSYLFERIGVVPNLIPRAHIFTSFKDCIDWIKEKA